MFRIILICLALMLPLSAAEVVSLTPTTISVAENSLVSDKILKSFDGNEIQMNGVTYTMATNGHWKLDSTSGPLKQTATYDFESTSETADKTITVYAKGIGGTPQEFTIAVTVTDVNESPVGITFSGNQAINENARGVAAASASSGDVDATATNDYSWSLVDPPSGLNDNSHFRINNSTGILSVDSDFDYETLDPTNRRNGTSNKVFARAFVELRDGNFTPITKEVWIEIRDVNEAPTGVSFGGTQVIDENATGSVATSASSGDVDASTTNKYVWSLVAPSSGINDNGNFTINASTGALSVSSAFNYETLAATPNDRRNGTNDKIFARAFVSLQDGSFSPITREVWIEIRDVNEPPTDVTFGGARAINENATGEVATSAASGDIEVNNSYVWSLVAPPSGLNDNGNFTINASTGTLSVSSAFNYEILVSTAASRRNGTTNKIFARAFVSLKDGTLPAITKEAWIEIHDVNEAPTDMIFGGTQVIDENTTGLVSTSAASGDVDASSINSYAWSLVDPQNGINDNGKFTINASTGALTISSAFDYENLVSTAASRRNGTTNMIFARAFVSLKDGSLPAITKEVWIEIRDVNEAPADVAFGGTQVIDENATGSVATSAASGDLDAPAINSYAWSLVAPPSGLNDNGNFNINASTGALSVSVAFDYETLAATANNRRNGTSDKIFARAFVSLKDGVLSAIRKEVWIEIHDRNEPPTDVTFGGTQAIEENVTGGVATSGSSGDADDPVTNRYVWSLVAPPSGINDNLNFSLNASTGVLSVTTAFNYETLGRSASSRRNGTIAKVFARAFVSLKDASFVALSKEVWIEVKDLDEAPVIVNWDAGTNLSDPTVNLRVGEDPDFSIVDPDEFNESYRTYDNLKITIDLDNEVDEDKLSLSSDLLSQLTLSTVDGITTAYWPFPSETAGVPAPRGIAKITPFDAGHRLLIEFQRPATVANTAEEHVTGEMLKEVLRTIMFGNSSRDYTSRTIGNPSVKISFPNGSSLSYDRVIDVTNINAPPIVSQASSIVEIQRGSNGVLDKSALIVVDDHPEAAATLVIDSLTTAGVLQRVQAGVATALRVGDAIPLVRVADSNQLDCPELHFVPSSSSSATTDSFICHAVDGGVLVNSISKFSRSSPLTRISLTIKEAAIPRFGVPVDLSYTYPEQTIIPLLVGTSLTMSVPASNFRNWRLVINGIAGSSLANNGLDPHDVLSLAPGLVTRTGNTLAVGTVLIGSIVDGYDGIGRPLAIDFTDMVGLTTLTATDVVLALAQQLQFSSSSRIMAQNLGAKHSLFLGFIGRTGTQSSFIELPLQWVGVPDAPTWDGNARVVMSKVQTVHGTLVCHDADSGPGSPVDPSSVTFTVLDGGQSVTLGQPVVTRNVDGWQYLVPWTWSISSSTAEATGGTFRVRASNVVVVNQGSGGSDQVITGLADATISIAITGNDSATLNFVNDAPMGLLATGTSGAWRVNLDQQLRVVDGQGAAVTSDQLQFALAGTPPPGTTIDPQTGTLQIHFVEATTVPTAEYRFAVLVNSIASTSTANGILPVVLMIGATPSGSN